MTFYRRLRENSLVSMLFLELTILLLTVFAYVVSSVTGSPIASVVVFVGLITASALLLNVIRVFRSTVLRQVDRLVRHRFNGVERRIEIFSNAITKFSTGNLTAGIVAPPLNGSFDVPGPLTELAYRLERIDQIIDSSIDAFNSVTNTPSKRICFVGNNAYDEGQLAGQSIGEFLKGKGQVAIILPSFSDANHNLRCKGCHTTLTERYPEIAVVHIAETSADPALTKVAVTELLDNRPDVDLIYITEGNTPATAADQIKKRHRLGKTWIACHDILPENVALIKNGCGAFLIGQNSFAQAYDSMIHVYNTIVTGHAPLAARMLMTPVIVNLENLADHWSDTDGRRMSAELKTALAQPLKRQRHERKKIRLGFIVPETSEGSFFKTLSNGAVEAIEVLSKHGVEVTIFDTFDKPANFGRLEVVGPVIERLIKEQYDGFATTVFDRKLIPLINDAVDRGIVVSTYNTEPTSFREMMNMVVTHVEELASHSKDVAQAADDSDRLIVEIGNKLEQIKRGAENQGQQVSLTKSVLNSFLDHIASVNRIADESAEAAKSATTNSSASFDSVSQSREGIAVLNQTSAVIRQSVQSLRDKFKEIGSTVDTIIDIADQTKLLALNATLQSVKAGEHGRGFSVITGEIRNLAEESTRATEAISQIVETLYNYVTEAEDASKMGLEQVNKNVDLADHAEHSIKSIKDSLVTNEHNLTAIDQAIEMMQKSSNDAKQAMRRLDNLNSDNVDALDRIYSSTKKITVQSNELSKTATVLSEMARNQELVLTQFVLNDE